MTMSRAYIIAEAGVNHDGRLDDALALIDAAAASGADCIKFQTFDADALASVRAPKADYQKRMTRAQESQREMLHRLELPREAYPRLLARARERGVAFLSTPFDSNSLHFLIDLGLHRIKIGSGDMTNAPLLLELARSGCSVVLSTGMADLAEVEEGLSVLAFGYTYPGEAPSRQAFRAAWATAQAHAALTKKVVLLHCTTEYPAPMEAANLRAIDTLTAAFGLPVGYSDHTSGIEIAVAAAARGAVVIEKHLTLDVSREGPDHAASLEPAEFGRMVTAIRNVEAALGDGRKVPQATEFKNIPIARKALVAAQPIASHEALTIDNIAVKRPGDGLPPITLWEMIGRPAGRAYETDEAIEP
jgi:N-acetylneuraminate synthase